MKMPQDLRTLVDSTGPFLTIGLPAPSNVDNAQHRLEIRWKNARRGLDESRWSDPDLAELDRVVGGLAHDGGEALVVIRAADGRMLTEFLAEPVDEFVADGALPRLALIIEGRQRSVSHILVETDRAGADIHAFEGIEAVHTDQVEGDTEHIHRGHPGGWSQRRFQQRAENTWERNADDVAEAIVAVDTRSAAEMIFIAGDVRAKHLVMESLPERLRDRTVLIEAGSPEGIADEVVRMLSDHVARGVRSLVEQLKDRLGTGTASTDAVDILAAFEAGRVESLLVHDDGSDGPVTTDAVAGVAAGARVVDVAIAAALRSDAEVTVVPNVAVLDGPIAALYRW